MTEQEYRDEICRRVQNPDRLRISLERIGREVGMRLIEIKEGK